MSVKQSRSFVECLREAIAEDLIVASSGVIENTDKWVKCAEGISDIASALYPEDGEGRRSFLNNLLGIETEYLDT